LCALLNKRLGGQSRDSTKFFTITTKTLRNEVENSEHARRALPHLPWHHFCTYFEFMPYAAHPGWSVMLLSAKNNSDRGTTFITVNIFLFSQILS
jgi:hypothetical protein